MDGSQFDYLTLQLAENRVSRRAGLRRLAAAGLAAAGLGAQGRFTARAVAAQGTPAAQATPFTCPSPTSTEMNIDGAWVCKQTFALCTTAPCELDADDATIANCLCVVEDAYAVGFKTCSERAQSGSSLYSNFSTFNVNSEFGVMTCPENAPWANCLDVPCEINAENPALATCQCAVVETGPSLTFGGGCDTSTCTSTIWSAAPEGLLGLQQYETGMACANQPVVLPDNCPAGTPVPATPSA